MKAYTRIAGLRVFRAPVFVHWSVFVAVGLLLLMSAGTLLQAAVGSAAYLAIIALHELGHAWFAHRQGLGVYELRIGFIHGACLYEDPGDVRTRAMVAWGGVAAQVAVAIPVLAAHALTGFGDVDPFGPVVAFLGFVNLLFAAFNLIPAPTLDGGTAWRLIPLWLARARATKRGKLRVMK